MSAINRALEALKAEYACEVTDTDDDAEVCQNGTKGCENPLHWEKEREGDDERDAEVRERIDAALRKSSDGGDQ